MGVPIGLVAERRLVMRLMRAGAVSVDTAQPLDGLHWAQARRLIRLIDAGAIREARPGSYYLNTAALADRLTRRRRRAALALAAVLALMAIVAWFHLA